MAANKTIGGINVTITATTEKFAKGIAQAQKLTKGFTSSLKGLVFNLKTLGAALATGAFVKLVKDQFDAINALKDLSDKTGISTDKLAGLQLAAEEAGIPIALLEKSLTTLNNKMGMAGDQALRVWIEKTSKLTSQQEKLAAATEMFGSKGASMVRFLNGGVEALDEAQRAAESMGLAITQDMAIGVDRASEAFARFKMSVTGIFRSLAAEIAPFVELLSIKASAFLSSNGQGKGIGTFIADVIVEMAKNVADSVNWMAGTVVKSIGDVMLFIKDWRMTGPAEALGFGFKSNQERGAAFSSAAKIRSAGLGILNAPPSVAIQAWVDEARKQSEAAAAKWKASNSGPDLLDMAGSFAKNMLGPTAQSWMGAAKGLGGMYAQQFGWMAKAASMITNPSAAAQRPSLAFAESGSVESYRQQAAIRRQNESQKLDKDRNGLLREIRDELKGQPQFAVAGIG